MKIIFLYEKFIFNIKLILISNIINIKIEFLILKSIFDITKILFMLKHQFLILKYMSYYLII